MARARTRLFSTSHLYLLPSVVCEVIPINVIGALHLKITTEYENGFSIEHRRMFISRVRHLTPSIKRFPLKRTQIKHIKHFGVKPVRTTYSIELVPEDYALMP